MSDLLLDLAHGPHLSQCNGTLFSMFQTCAASPQNLALLDRYADAAQFARPDRESLRQTGELYRRFGETEKAALWFRRADMPETFMARIAKERPMFHAGRVTGILRWNGRPLAGADVAAAPLRLNGLTPEMGQIVYGYANQIMARRHRAAPPFGPYHPQPFALRLLSAAAKTDANGKFQLQNLTEGSYWLLVRLPENIELISPVDSRLTLRHVSREIDLKYEAPAFDAGNNRFNVCAGSKILTAGIREASGAAQVLRRASRLRRHAVRRGADYIAVQQAVAAFLLSGIADILLPLSGEWRGLLLLWSAANVGA